MTWQVWAFLALCLVAAVAYAVARIARGRRLARMVINGDSAALEAEQAAAGARARVEANKAADAAQDARSEARAAVLVEAVRQSPPAPAPDADGVRAGDRPRSRFADELGLDR